MIFNIFKAFKHCLSSFKRMGRLRFCFSIIEPTPILFMDNDYAGLSILFKNYIVYDEDKVFVYHLIRSLFSLRKWKYVYKASVIMAYNPRVIILHHYSNINIINRLQAESKVIVYQFSSMSRSNLGGFTNGNSKCNVLFCFNEDQYNILNKKIDSAKWYITGPIVGNNRVLPVISEKKYDILFVSEYRGNRSLDKRQKMFHFYQKEIFNVLNGYCSRNNLRIGVAYSSLRADKKNKFSILEERGFFGQNQLLSPEDLEDSYQKASKSNVVVCLLSNLGFELLSQGYKVIYIDVYSRLDAKFKLTQFPEDDSLFCVRSRNNDAIYAAIKENFELNDKEWKKQALKLCPGLLTSDVGNKTIKSVVEKLAQL